MKRLFLLLLLLALPSARGQVSFSRINSLPLRSTPASTDMIPASKADGTTVRIPFNKFSSAGGDALTTDTLAQFAPTTSLELKGVISDETGSGALVFGTSPTLTTPNLGTPSAVTLTNGTGLPASGISSGTIATARLGSGTASSSTYLRGDQTWATISGGGDALVANPLSQFAATTSLQLAGVITNETGSGALVFGTSPTLTTPNIGVATATSINGNTITTGTGTITLAAGKTVTAPNKTGNLLVGDDLNLAGGTALTIGEHYYDSISADRTFTFSGSPIAGGNATIVRLNVTAPCTITFPSSNRIGAATNPTTTLDLPIGWAVLAWSYSNGGYLLTDSVGEAIDDVDINFTDNTTGDVSTAEHGYAPKGDGDSTHFLNGLGAYSAPAGASVPTGTGFRHVTSGVEDGATVGETGTTAVVRANGPTISGANLSSSVQISSSITPTLSGDVNDWAPTGLSSATMIKVDGGAADRNVTGLTGGATGRIIALANVGTTNKITLADQNTSSSAANRFLAGADMVLLPNQTVALRYDSTAARWRPLGFFPRQPAGAIVGTTDTQTLTNKTLTTPVINHISGSATPTATGDTGAGSGPPSITVAGNDRGFHCSFTTGTSPAATATVFTVTFASAFPSTPVVIGPIAQNSGANTAQGSTKACFVTSVSTTGFTFTSGSAGLTASVNYDFGFLVFSNP